MICVRRTVPHKDFPCLSRRMREADANEVMASSGHSPEEAIVYSFRVSEVCYVIDFNYVPFLIFGLARHEGFENVGVPWMLATDEINDHRIAIAKLSRRWAEEFNRRYEYLVNYVDVRNELAKRWLEWCGFQETRTIVNFGVGQIPFVEMVRDINEIQNQTSSK
jgi:ribosomal protein S18 acetylase RimI-like enzyme